MRRVILESPYKGDVEQNLKYARACVRDCLMRGESPLASHLLFTQEGILNDSNRVERELGIAAGLAWGAAAQATVVYTDHGISDGMDIGIKDAARHGRPVEYRRLESNNV
jgi:hypothetical protein